MADELPGHMFSRQDESPDEQFYSAPRFVTHIDDATINAITEYYREALSPDDVLLDLMSSWISHLPPEVEYKHVTGLGMNQDELDDNPRLDQRVVHNLNTNPFLDFPDNHFDAVMIVVSIQYLARPFEVFPEIGRVLKPGGQCIVAMSHRLFPTKAIYAFQAMTPADRVKLVSRYMQQTGLLEDVQFIDRSPEAADPLWIIHGVKKTG